MGGSKTIFKKTIFNESNMEFLVVLLRNAGALVGVNF